MLTATARDEGTPGDEREEEPGTVQEEAARVEAKFKAINTHHHRIRLATELNVSTSSIPDLINSQGEQLFRSKVYPAKELWENGKLLNCALIVKEPFAFPQLSAVSLVKVAFFASIARE